MVATERNTGLGRDSKHENRRCHSSPDLRWLIVILTLGLESIASAETWRGLTVAPERGCSLCDRKRDYLYPQSVKQEIMRALGAVYGPYAGTCFASSRETGIEHVVATSEAHASGRCAAEPSLRLKAVQKYRAASST